MNVLTAKFFSFIVHRLPPPLIAQQAKKPDGFLGKYIMKPMFSLGNADINHFVMQQLDVRPQHVVLEIGFGPGLLADDIACELGSGEYFGLDFSDTMIQEASKLNRWHIRAGKMHLVNGDSKQLPFRPEKFHSVCSVNTLYFWQPVEQHFAEIFRCLKPKGKVVIGFRDAEQIEMIGLDEQIFARYSQPEVAQLLTQAGFEEVRILQDNAQPLKSYCAVGIKPE